MMEIVEDILETCLHARGEHAVNLNVVCRVQHPMIQVTSLAAAF